MFGIHTESVCSQRKHDGSLGKQVGQAALSRNQRA
jgi:hypothetical protein